jgi:hypothetical protein
MDCREHSPTRISFSIMVSIAATHHLDDLELTGDVQALRVAGWRRRYIVDAILPQTGNRAFKRLWFDSTPDDSLALSRPSAWRVAGQGTILAEEMLPDRFHDCVYSGFGRDDRAFSSMAVSRRIGSLW